MASFPVAAVAPPRQVTRPLRLRLALPAVVIAGAAILVVIGLLAPVPSTPDEAIYIELARHLGLSGKFEILGVAFPGWTYGPAYVALIAPIFRIAPTAREAYLIVRALNAFAFAAAAVPAYLIAIRAVSRRTALVVAAATIVLPASVYTTKVMTESLAYLVVLWTVLAALRVLERPSVARQAVLVVSSLAAAAVRFELLALAPALALVCIFGKNCRVRDQIRRLAPLLLSIGAIVMGAGVLVHFTSSAAAGAGAHGLDLQKFSFARFAASTVGSLGAFDLYTGVVPFACLLYALVSIRRNAQWVSPGLRAVALMAGATTLGLVVSSSAYLGTLPVTARPSLPPDRYLFYVAPLLLVVLGAWIEAGCIREAGMARVAVTAAVLPLLAVIVDLSGVPLATINAIAFLPWALPWIATAGTHPPLLLHLGQPRPLLLLAALGAYGGLCAWRLARPKMDAHALIKPLLVCLTVTTVCAYFANVSAHSYSLPPGWLDAHTNAGAIALWADSPNLTESQALREIVGANDNLSAIYFVRQPDSLGLQQVERRIVEHADGTLAIRGRPLNAQYVLTAARTRIVGTLIARRNGFAIYRARLPLRLAN
ncbi:MAG TPA: hypothetical protein VIP09_13185 [Dehalococcoidia bacterium]